MEYLYSQTSAVLQQDAGQEREEEEDNEDDEGFQEDWRI